MRIISRKALRAFAGRHPEAQAGLDHWFRAASAADWQNITDVRREFPHADAAEAASGNIVTIFNVAGNRFRLITAIHYNRSRVYVLLLLTHAEYSKDQWKRRL